MYTVAEVEDAIVEALKGSTLLASACKKIETYGGQLESLAREAPSLTFPLPAVLIVYSRSAFSEPANRSFDEEMTFTAVILASNLRGLSALRVGAYALLDLVRSALIDNDLGLNLEPIHPLSVEAIWISEEMAVYGFEFKTSQSLD